MNNLKKSSGKKIKINIIEITQKGNVFYIGKIKASELVKVATVHVRGSNNEDDKKYINEVKEKLVGTIRVESDEESIQRGAQLKRLKEIKEYLEDVEGFLPNSLIIAINNKVIWDNGTKKQLYDTDGYELKKIFDDIYELTLYSNMVDAFIVDGQHRLGAFAFTEDETIDDYELPVTIFIEMEISLQAEVFGVVNSKQKPVNKSLLYDLRELSDNDDDSIKRCHAIAKWFNENENSPFYNKIKMLGTGYGSLSQSAFIDELVKYVEKRDGRYSYRSFLKDVDNKLIIKRLYDYFRAIKEIYGEDVWDDTDNYVLTKTTGFGALMKAFYYIYIYMYVKDIKFTRSNFDSILKPIKRATDFSSNEVGKSAGQGLQRLLSKRILSVILFKKKYSDEISEEIDEKLKELEAEYVLDRQY